MKLYNTEKVLDNISARIRPIDKNIPDCICMLVLTEEHFYVIEDNYDGSYTEHYVIDVSLIKDIRLGIPEKNESKPAPGSAADLEKGREARIFRLKAPGRLRGVAIPEKYLEIIYNDENNLKQHLYFDECDDQVKRFINSFKKIQSLPAI